MRKRFFIFTLFCFIASNVMAANGFIPKRFNTITSHDDVYPYILNNAKQNTTKKSSSTSANVSSNLMGKRNVVRRKTNARAATSGTTTIQQNNQQTRRVVERPDSTRAATNTSILRQNNPRQNTSVNPGRSLTPVRTRTATTTRATVNTAPTTQRVSSQRCMADYKECMEQYCQREDTPYNRCYCSAKLAQIDSKYQNKIDELITKIIKLQYDSPEETSDEIREYWDQSVGTYTQTNPWVNIDDALNISWADMQSRVRGQNAFNTGHEYCMQHLRACYSMATNMRDAYKSEIARDCATYEKGLQKIQAAAESVIESYHD